MIEIITKYFPELNEKQKQQFEMLNALYRDWNAKINVISRKDIDNLYEHHVLHSLAIAKAIRFKDGSRILDFGTGGGFPGIPLAIMFPKCKFRLIDGTGKKIMVANEVANALGLQNVEALHRRGEEEKGEYDFVVSRAVMQLPLLTKIIQKNISKKQNNALPNGLLCLKGGDLKEELKPYLNIIDVMPLEDMFDEEWFKEDKKLIYLPMA
ncbi:MULTISPECIES: 16S rRNA (guanine(527)-N(7))-methyltransferase RsmG [Prevotella]|uniref:Ribosomal RNA small subunit methyltransferase G n=1 Tax=Prevotella herbatica TaxID=2801997 RepID=A0ABN6EKD3_9BACT|nr:MULTISPECIES: 16S rRNA (guanine(527)-N(7))-methyltransferase RsmG [Prevotella]MDN5554845.1 16S rRNA (guanine(527)-N(7))-methyltransferase RsmG [Prevotella sp.]MDN5554852.1 16S rRNA (guanine(527)-N(7))-methyltransferase RsmG [Prevotella sp.]BCS86371.1 ribosomal RNA small subunit methyltransferase G [Prevotella herbatica]